MNVGLLTWFHYHNYGTALQVTALSHVIREMGCPVDVIHYQPQGERRFLLSDDVVSYYADRIKGAVKGRLNRIYAKAARESLFEEFLKKNLSFSKPCVTFSDFRELNDLYGAFVCGSDQIWAPTCFDERYFLDFAEDPKRMVSYAPSVGLTSVKDKDIEKEMQRLAGRFEWISTREYSGSELISQLIQKPVETVLDPTLLLPRHKWGAMASDTNSQKEPYLLAYFLRTNRHYWKKTYELAQKLHLKVKVIPVFCKDLGRRGCIKTPIGPSEFLELMEGASFVCTDSFHGMAFAINFNKEFTVFERFKKNEGNNQNSRIYHLLKITKLSARLYQHGLSLDGFLEKIEYDSVNDILFKWRKKSLDFLSAALESIKNHIEQTEIKKYVSVEDGFCCGCGACASVCPVHAVSLQLRDGFLCANVDKEQCISCGKCQKVCPLYGEREGTPLKNGKLFSYKDNSMQVLKTSSSGGIAYRIAETYLKKGYCAAGCMFDKKEQRARHIFVLPKETEKLALLQGSKYLQSDFIKIILALKKGIEKTVVFGTPCQIAAARKMAGEREDIVYVDLICHGVPSQLLYQKYQQYLQDSFGMDQNRLEVSFRDKKHGWRERYIYSRDLQKSHCAHQSKDPFFLMFESMECYSKPCYECRFRDFSAADIRIGDYWGPKFLNDKDGVSMVICMNEKGEGILQELNGYADIMKQDISDYFCCQQSKNSPIPVFYRRLLADLANPSVSMEHIIKKFVQPYMQRKKVWILMSDIRRLLKKNGK